MSRPIWQRRKQAEITTSSLRYLLSELHQLLEVVVLGSPAAPRILDSQHRQEELETLLQLLAEVEQQAPKAQRAGNPERI